MSLTWTVAALFLDRNEIALRPKTFAVMQYMFHQVAGPCCFKKRSCFPAVAETSPVTDDVLVQEHSQLQKALETTAHI